MNAIVKGFDPNRKYKASELASGLLTLRGDPLKFDKHKPWEFIYNVAPPEMVLKAGRQVGKSVSQGGRTIIQSVTHKHFQTAYVAPSQKQASIFSNMYLKPFRHGKIVRKYFMSKDSVDNVYEKEFSNGSKIYVRYAQNEQEGDRIRGITADQILYDEVQDILLDAIHVINPILDASKYRYKIYSGTSKSTANTLERLWLRSNQMEWAMKCDHCRKWNIPNTYARCIAICRQPEGPVCYHCGKSLDVNKGQWIETVQDRRRVYGLHLPQFVMSSNTGSVEWADLHAKVAMAEEGFHYSPGKLANENFGLATDLSGKAISVHDALACCRSEQVTWFKSRQEAQKEFGHLRVVCGVDWSCTGSTKSYTVASVVGMDLFGRVHLLYAEIMQGIHILTQVDRIKKIITQYECDLCASDRGVGVVQAQLLQNFFGLDKVIMVQYVTANRRLVFNREGMFLAADRTTSMDLMVHRIRRGGAQFTTPSWNLTQGLWEHALSIFEEESERSSKRMYSKDEDTPDDWLHSLVFAMVGFEYMTGNYQFAT